MKAPAPSDADLRRRVQELGRREASSAPGFDGVLRGGGPPAREARRGLRISGWRPAIAFAGVFLVAAVAWWRPMDPRGGLPVAPPTERPWSDPVEEWVLPTDGLATETWEGAGPREVERLSREIEGLLRR
jgi:hypothetical protein